MFLGRYQQGMEVPVSITTTLANLSPAWPAAQPFMEVWKDASPPSLLATVYLASYQPGVTVGKFRASIFLGPIYTTTGRYFVVVRWTDTNGVPLMIVGSFELTGGGSAAGTVIAMAEVVRPDARYLLTSTDAGTLSRRKNPR